MLTQETKRHIDAARKVLVGVVPNPSSQIDQITNALIYKFMDDMDQSAIKAGGEPSFFVGNLERYAWTRIMDSRLGNQERMNLYIEALFKYSEAKQLPELFRSIFKSAFLPYRSPEVLGLFLKEIDYFDYSHSEELGNAYEYLLSIMGSQGDAGQFRTPRHIIDFIVAAVDPTIDDRVLDPACGTAGFLVSAYKYILEQHDGKNIDGSKNEEKPLTPDQRRTLMNNFEGYDVDPGMVRISQVNMYLHHFKKPKIYNYNTLTDEERWKDTFDVILANPPFMSPRGGVSTHNKFSISSNRSEVLFVDYFISHLRPKGRAGMIVPEGIIFQSASAPTALRKKLVDDGLYAVVSLPAGVFQPYAGVKTSILFFDNERAKQNPEILFVKVENDGFDLGATKRPIAKNDLPQALKIINEWKNGKKLENKLAVYVKRAVIAQSEDYNLSGDRYRVATDYTNFKWPMIELVKICVTDWGNTKLTKSSYRPGGQYLAISATGGDGRIEHFEHEVGVTVLSAIGANCGKVFFPDERFTAIKNTITFTPDMEKVIPKYLFYALNENNLPVRGGGQPFMSKGDVQKYKIPIPPLEIQQQIVTELDSYQRIISGARQIVNSWKPKIDIDPGWEKVKLGDVSDVNSESISVKQEKQYHYFDISSVENETGKVTINPAIKGKDLPSRARRFVKIGDILLSTVRPNLKAFAYLQNLPDNPVASTGFAVVSAKESVLGLWIYWLLFSEYLQEQMIARMGKGAYPSINQTDVLNLEIPLPSIENQKQIVEKVEAERTLVESSKKLIEIYEQKTKDVLFKLWAE